MNSDASMEIQFFSPDAQIPIYEPADEKALYFSPMARADLLQRTRVRAFQEGRPVFVAARENRLIAVGTTKTRRVVEHVPGAVRLSGSHAGHRLGPGLVLQDGRTYEVLIDPATSVILSATESAQQGPTPPASVNFPPPVDLPAIGRPTVDALFSRLRRQPHIPFQYPANGCSARAHEMCNLIENHLDTAAEEIVAKVWNFPIPGRLLRVRTENSPDCVVPWFYHVAPVVNGDGELLVIDPSLFEGPVSVAEWLSIQAGSSGDPHFTSRAAYESDRNDLYFAEQPNATMTELRDYRDDLVDQIYAYGPLPYRC